MSLVSQVLLTIAVSGVVLLTLCAVVIGPDRLTTALDELWPRLWMVLPYLGVMTVILLARAVTQDHAAELTLVLDLDLTPWIFAVEGGLVSDIQRVASPELSAYLVFMYLFGYVVLVTFPAVAYFCLPSLTQLKALLVAFIVNDAVGITLYVAFIARGPRNLGRGFAEPILYDMYPEAAVLTGAVNAPINVFPSLHASMAATVMFFAWRTRRVYPVWAVVATIFGLSVIFSTMYLGIHWVVDVVAGVLLAAVAVYVGTTVVRHEAAIGGRLRRSLPTA